VNPNFSAPILVAEPLAAGATNPGILPWVAFVEMQDLNIQIIDKTAGDDSDEQNREEFPFFLETFERLKDQVTGRQYRHQKKPTDQNKNSNGKKTTKDQGFAEES